MNLPWASFPCRSLLALNHRHPRHFDLSCSNIYPTFKGLFLAASFCLESSRVKDTRRGTAGSATDRAQALQMFFKYSIWCGQATAPDHTMLVCGTCSSRPGADQHSGRKLRDVSRVAHLCLSALHWGGYCCQSHKWRVCGGLQDAIAQTLDGGQMLLPRRKRGAVGSRAVSHLRQVSLAAGLSLAIFGLLLALLTGCCLVREI